MGGLQLYYPGSICLIAVLHDVAAMGWQLYQVSDVYAGGRP